ncbi:MAG: bifunctional nuclease family protein [Dysgonamonadaceae bacterium]|nr:bifunctional nuclease family protein [Dysgonamonadaceae bacterium]
MENNKIRLKILGITFSQVQTGAYALILKEEKGLRRLPIIIGTPEAQSIAIFLEGLLPPRPLTHDLFISFAQAINIELTAVDIYKYEDGVFFSELLFSKKGKELRIDSRTSDAIALAVRANAPIFITESIMDEVSIIMDDDDLLEELENPDLKKKTQSSCEGMNLEELQKNLNEAITSEDYEKASRIRDLINKRQDEKQ